MSENTPIPADTKRPSRGFLITLGVIIGLAAIIFSLSRLGEVKLRDGPRPDDGIRGMGMCLLTYAAYTAGYLPPTLRAMIPEYLPQQTFDDWRYKAQKTGERLDWLYFPREKLDALPPETILLASPATLLNTAGAQLRIVTNAAGQTDYIPEADFQRLIREQNPPPPRTP